VVTAVRILQVHNRYREPGGEDVVVSAEAELLRRAGHEVVQWQPQNPQGTLAAAAALARAPWNSRAAGFLEQIAARLRPHIAHVHNTWFAMSPSILPALRRAGVPVVMTLHNYRLLCANSRLFRDGRPCEDCVGSHPWHGVRHRCYRDSALQSLPAAGTIALHGLLGTWRREVSLFLALNDFSRARFVSGGLPPERIHVKPNFVVDPGPRTVPNAGSPTVLYVGRIVSEKGPGVLLEAWRRAATDSLELLFVGDGSMRPALQRLDVPGVRFAGHLPGDEVRRRMLDARALVLPTLSYEGQPMAALEALAAGVPVLASDIGGMPELLRPLGPGWLVPPGVEEAWAVALGRLTDARLVERGGRQARAIYEQSFNEASALGALEAAYASVLESASQRH
jgi:glycosyltransferase involved in cell wall biosynthesis